MALLVIFALFFAATLAYDENSCAYYATHEIATPLGVCSSYSKDDQQYGYEFECNEYGEVEMSIFSDTECSQQGFLSNTGDDEIGTSLQCIGSGDNCHTVDITIYGLTDPTMGSCDDASDVASIHYVVDECIPSIIEGIEYSSLLSCDAEKLWLEYYVGCETCDCDGEQYTEIFYEDLPGCFDINCGDHHEFTGVGVAETTQKPNKRNKCRRLDKDSIRTLKSFMANGVGFTEATFLSAQKQMFKGDVINGEIAGSAMSLYNKMVMNWIYIVAVLCAVMLLGGAWKLIKQKEYSMI